MQNTIMIYNKFVGAIANCYRRSDIINIWDNKCNAVGILGIISKDEKMIYLGYLGGHSSNFADGDILDSDTNSKQSEREEALEIIC